MEKTNLDISSLVDPWLLLRDVESSGERNRVLNLIKSRGMAHSNQLREFLLTDHGVDLLDAYLGPEGVLTGSMRLAQESRDRAGTLLGQQKIEKKQRELDRKRELLNAQIAALQKEFETEEEEAMQIIAQEKSREELYRHYQHPQLTKDEQIIAAPTLVKVLPQPLRRLIGDLSDTERVMLGLDLRRKL